MKPAITVPLQDCGGIGVARDTPGAAFQHMQRRLGVVGANADAPGGPDQKLIDPR